MSGYPSIEGVAEISALVAQSVVLGDEISMLQKTINEAEAGLKIAVEEFTIVNGSIIAKMERMDVTSSGNFGWQRRFTCFLTEFYIQIRKLPLVE